MPVQKQTGPYIPQNDRELRAYFDSFSSIVRMNPYGVGLSPVDADMLCQMAAEYSAALEVTENGLTRTSPAIARKDAVRNQAIGVFRVIAMQVKRNLGVPNSARTALGIHIDDTSWTPVPRPTTHPILSFREAQSGFHILGYADSATPDSKAKPAGALQLQLHVAIGDKSTCNPDDALHYGAFTKQPMKVTFDPKDAQRIATYFGRWITRTGLTGSWSLPLSMGIAFGGPVQA